MIGTRLPGRYLGATRVAHVMLDRGENALPGWCRYSSRCGQFWAQALLEADDVVPVCGSCRRALAADEARAAVLRSVARREAGVPYVPGDRARVLHAGAGGATVLGVLEVLSCRASEAAGGRWIVVFALEPDGWQATVGASGRDLHGYVEPVRP